MPDRRLRVLFVIGSMGGGGAERQLVELLKYLDRSRFEPRLYLAYRQGELLSEVPADVRIDAFSDGTSTRKILPQCLAKLRWPSGARAAHLRDLLQQEPVDVTMSWSLLCAYEMALATWKRNCPNLAYILVEPKSALDDSFPVGFPFRKRIARWAFHHANVVAGNSLALSDSLATFYRLPPSKMRAILNLRDLQRIDTLAQAGTPSWPGTGRKVVAVGRLNRQKGIDVLLRAMKRLVNAGQSLQLVLLGQGPDEESLRSMVQELELTSQVFFLGFQANPYAYLRSADLFVLPSRFEGLPNVLIEALVCRTPVVAADCPTGPREILDQGQHGPLVPVEDVEAFTAAMQQVLSSPPSESQRESARQSMFDRYDVRQGIHSLERLLLEMASTSAELRP